MKEILDDLKQRIDQNNELFAAPKIWVRGGREPEVIGMKGLGMQVCVPADWSDGQVIEFAEAKNPCGTTCGWNVMREGDEWLKGDPERNPCKERNGFVHVALNA